MKQTEEPLTKILKIFNESPYGNLSIDSYEAKDIKNVLDRVLASYKVELRAKIEKIRKPKNYYNSDWNYALDQAEALLEDNPTEK